jgi:hypothetical protein
MEETTQYRYFEPENFSEKGKQRLVIVERSFKLPIWLDKELERASLDTNISIDQVITHALVFELRQLRLL